MPINFSGLYLLLFRANAYLLKITKYFSPYLKNKLDEYNDKKDLNAKPVSLSETGLELIEAVQIDTSLGKHWQSNPQLEDKANPKEKIKGEYRLTSNKFKIKFAPQYCRRRNHPLPLSSPLLNKRKLFFVCCTALLYSAPISFFIGLALAPDSPPTIAQ